MKEDNRDVGVTTTLYYILYNIYTIYYILLFVYTDLTHPPQYHYLFTQTLRTHYNTIICLHRPYAPITIPSFVYTDLTNPLQYHYLFTQTLNTYCKDNSSKGNHGMYKSFKVE